MNDTLATALLFLPAILVAVGILIIQIRGDFFELKHRVKRWPKVSILITLSANHSKNINTIEMIQDQNYKNTEVILLANPSYKKALGRMKYYRNKNRLQNVRILTGKTSKQRAREGNVKGQFVMRLPSGSNELAKNSLSQAVARLHADSKHRQPYAGIVLFPPLDTSLKGGLYFTRRVLAAYLARAYSFFPRHPRSRVIVLRKGKRNIKRLYSSRKNRVTKFLRWAPLTCLVLWTGLFGSYAIGSWAIVIFLLILLGIFAQLNLKNHPIHTRLSVILLTPIIIFIPTSKA